MKMKHILAFLLILILPLTTYASGNNEMVNNFLTDLNFVENIDDTKNDKEISRGQFSVLAAKLIPFDLNTYEVKNQMFVDVPLDLEEYRSIMLLYDLGYVSGSSSLKFSPNDSILVKDACAILVRILGYEFNVKDGNYFLEALSRDLLKGVNLNQDDKMTTQNAYNMIYNTLFAEEIVGNKKTEYRILIEERFGIYECAGTVTDDGENKMAGKSEVKPSQLVIDGINYENKTGKNDFLGCYVKGYYKVKDGTKNLLHAFVSSGKNNIKKFIPEDIHSYENGVYECYIGEEQSRTAKYTLDKKYKIIYNQVAVSSLNSSVNLEKMMKPESGFVKLVNNDGLYELVVIKNYETFVASGIDKEKKIIYNRLTEPAMISLEKTVNLNITNESGDEVNFETIKDCDIVSVAQSADQTYADIIVSTKKVTGKISFLESDKKTLKIDDVQYDTTEECSKISDFPAVGMEITAYLRYDGKISYLEQNAYDSDFFVYLADVCMLNSLDNSVILKIYTQTNEVKEVNLKEKAIIDGKKYSNLKEAFDYIKKHKYGIGNLVLVRFNDNDEITYMDFSYNAIDDQYPSYNSNEGENSLHITEGIYKSEHRLFSDVIGNNLVGVDDTTKAFIVPSKGDTEDIFVTKVSAGIVSYYNPKYKITAYASDKNKLIASAIVIYRDVSGYDITNVSVSTRLDNAIVTDIADAVNVNGDMVKKLTITNGGDITFVYTESINGARCLKSGKEVMVGDIIKYGTNKTKEIPDNQLVIMYSPSEDKENLIYNDGYFTGNTNNLTCYDYGIIKGDIMKLNNRYFQIACDNGEKRIFSLATVKYVLYDSTASNKVTLGDYTDMISSEANNGEGSTIILDYSAGKALYAYIIK
ncbi:MAG: hypothetical protein RSB38_04975 [Oscillospiraceae bacterium]